MLTFFPAGNFRSVAGVRVLHLHRDGFRGCLRLDLGGAQHLLHLRGQVALQERQVHPVTRHRIRLALLNTHLNHQ